MTITHADIDWKNILLKRYRSYSLEELDVMVLFMCDLVLSIEADQLLTADLLSSYMSAKKEDIDASLNKLLEKKYLTIDKNSFFSLESFKERLFEDLKKDLYLATSTDNSSSSAKLVEYLEKLIGRTLSPIEKDSVFNWLKSGASEDQIKEACQKSINKSGSISMKRAEKLILEMERGESRKGIGASMVNEDTRKKTDIQNLMDYDWTTN